jgi:hypothetical protein
MHALISVVNRAHTRRECLIVRRIAPALETVNEARGKFVVDKSSGSMDNPATHVAAST